LTVQVASVSGGEGVDVAVASDGTVYVSWVSLSSTWLVVSTDLGETFSDPLQVGGATTAPQVYENSHPSIALDEDRIAISQAGGGHHQVWVADRADLSFSTLVEPGASRTDLMYESIFIRSTFAPSGDLWTSLHAFPEGGGWSGGWKAIAGEPTDWTLESVSSGAPGEPCECCPQDFLFTDQSELVYGYRNNEENLREIYAASGTAGALSAWQAVSSGGWSINYCPVQGPRVCEGASGTVHMTWADASTGVYRVYLARSQDAGVSWTEGVYVSDDGIEDEESPAIASDGEQSVWMAYSTRNDAFLVASSDGGESFEAPVALVTPDGDLEYPELAYGGGYLFVAGAGDGDGIWLLRY